MPSNTIWQQSEVVRTKLFPKWQGMKYNTLSDFISKGEVEVIGERDYRVPAQVTAGGRFGAYDPQMGDMGRGTSPTGVVMLQSFYNLRLNFEFDMKQIKATTNRKVAVQNPFLQCVADGYRELQLYWDKVIHGNGTAKLATATSHSSSSGVSVYTLDNAFGGQLLRRGQYVNVYDSTLATLKSANVLNITALQVNPPTRTATLSGVVPSAANTDVLCFEGVSGASPAGPRGLKYWISSATSGTTAGIDRAVEGQIISKSVTASGYLTPELPLALYHRILNDRLEVANGLLGLAAPAQQAYVVGNLMSIQNYNLADASAKAVDRLPALKGKDSFMWGNVPHWLDVHQDQTVVPYIVPSLWGIAQLAPTGFFETPGKSGPDARFFPLYGGSGAPAAGVWFGLTSDRDLYTIDPGAQGLISSLSLPTLYS